jgi:hypothetical protein
MSPAGRPSFFGFRRIVIESERGASGVWRTDEKRDRPVDRGRRQEKAIRGVLRRMGIIGPIVIMSSDGYAVTSTSRRRRRALHQRSG